MYKRQFLTRLELVRHWHLSWHELQRVPGPGEQQGPAVFLMRFIAPLQPQRPLNQALGPLGPNLNLFDSESCLTPLLFVNILFFSP